MTPENGFENRFGFGLAVMLMAGVADSDEVTEFVTLGQEQSDLMGRLQAAAAADLGATKCLG